MQDTVQAAKERILREYPDAQFLEEICPGRNILWLSRQEHLYRQPYLPTLATIVGETPKGKVRIAIYASGQETRVVSSQTLFTRECDWCSGKPIVSHMHYSDYIQGTIYWNRHKYVRRYDRSLDSEEVEQRAAQDWQDDPASFTEEE